MLTKTGHEGIGVSHEFNNRKEVFSMKTAIIYVRKGARPLLAMLLGGCLLAPFAVYASSTAPTITF